MQVAGILVRWRLTYGQPLLIFYSERIYLIGSYSVIIYLAV